MHYTEEQITNSKERTRFLLPVERMIFRDFGNLLRKRRVSSKAFLFINSQPVQEESWRPFVFLASSGSSALIFEFLLLYELDRCSKCHRILQILTLAWKCRQSEQISIKWEHK